MYVHQDWNVVVFKKKDIKAGNNNGDVSKKVSYAECPVSIKKLDEDREEFNHKKITKDIADTIKSKRIELKLSQSDLAKKINEKPNVIQEVESMKGIYNHILLNKIARALGISLKKNKA